MARNSGLLEKSSAPSVNDNGRASDAEQRRSDLGYSLKASIKLPETDEFLEDTLVNNRIERSELLTKREAEVLRLIVSGRTNKEAARMLCRSERTVEYHRSRLMHKLGAHNAAELVKQAIALGLR